MDHRQLKENIRNFSLDDCPRGNQGFDRVLLQLFGFLGHGKSSLINSCTYALKDDGEFEEHAVAKDTEGGQTMIRNDYQLTSNITMVDNRGYNTMSNFQTAEVYAQLGNFMPLNKMVEWKDSYSAMMRILEESEMDPNFTDFIVPVLVYSAKTGLAEGEMPDMQMFVENCIKMTGVAPIIILTHKTSGDYIRTEQQFKRVGAETVISVVNYTKESNIKTLGRTTDFLMFIDGAIKQVKFRMEQTRNPRRERMERKKFLLDYIHEADCKKREEVKKEQEKLQEEKETKKGFWEWFTSLFTRK